MNPRPRPAPRRGAAGPGRPLALVALALLVALGLLGRGARAQGGAPADTLAEVPDTVSVIRDIPLQELERAAVEDLPPDSAAAVAASEAQDRLRNLWVDFLANLPKYGIALGVLLVAWVLVRIVRPILRRALHQWDRAQAVAVLVGLGIWILALGIALSVLVNDIGALLGSIGLLGLALSWALRTPIESFTGWLMNSIHGYYRVGDRVAVPERNVFGDVFRIDLLTTTMWEYGGLDRSDVHVHGEQATGRLITFPNNQVLNGTIVNYTRDFPYVWDELTIRFHRSTDVRYLLDLMKRLADEVVGEAMAEPARAYAALVEARGLEPWAGVDPQVYVSVIEEKWILVIVRYLVGARERRRWQSALVTRIMEEMQTPESRTRLKQPTPRRLLQFLDGEGRPSTPWMEWRAREEE